jgi:hypothetical protein
MSHAGRETWFHKKGTHFVPPNIIRYADDFVILHENKAVVQRCREIISEWLAGIGLELKPEKTRLTHTLNHELKGMDFLLFKIRCQNGWRTIETRLPHIPETSTMGKTPMWNIKSRFRQTLDFHRR